jgi:hypothetical protein
MEDKTWWPVGHDDPDGDLAVLVLVGAASLSGQLDDAESDEDLREAINRTFSLVSCGVLSSRAVAEEAVDIERDLIEWGQALDRKRREVAESN